MNQASTDFGRSVAVVIGVNQYRHGIAPLSNSVRDAQVMGRLLRWKYGYEVWPYLDNGATHAALEDLVQNRIPQASPSIDRLVIYFAGHGLGGYDEKERFSGFLLPQDAERIGSKSFWAMRSLRDALSRLNGSCKHLLVILDCCFAGAFPKVATRDLEPMVEEKLPRERYKHHISRSAFQLLVSTAQDERAADRLALKTASEQWGSTRHSPFAQALLQALGRGQADLNRDGVITATELYACVREELAKVSQQTGLLQTPGLWPLDWHDQGEFVFLVGDPEQTLPPAKELSESTNPYRGLESFGFEDRAMFFGRKEAVRALQEAVSSRPLTVVTGGSGTGKTSLVQAGLLPALQRLHKDWAFLPPFRPGRTPLQTLGAALSSVIPGGEARVLKGSEQELREWLGACPSANVVLVVDQLEELVTLAVPRAERERFLWLLGLLVAERCFRVICTLRSDYEPSFVGGALRNWDRSRFPIPSMTQEELREAIEGPAGELVLTFRKTSLPARIASAVVAMPGALPLLSFTLSQLYLSYLRRARQGGIEDRTLTDTDYDALGGVHGALWARADAIFASFDTATQRTMRHLMLRMVSLERGQMARRQVPLSELEFADPQETQRCQLVREALERTDARLVISSSDKALGPYIEPAHDALVRGWKQIEAWLGEEQDRHIVHRRLTEASVEWKRLQDNGLLWDDDPRLARVDPAQVNKLENEFIEASTQLRKRKQRVQFSVAAALGVAILAGLGITLWKNDQLARRFAANLYQSAAEAEAQGDVIRGALLAAEALEQASSSDPMRPSYAAKVVHLAAQAPRRQWNLPFRTGRAIFSPDRRNVLLVSDGAFELAGWNLQTGQKLKLPISSLGKTYESPLPVFSPDGRWLAALPMQEAPDGSHRLHLYVWEVETGEPRFSNDLGDDPSLSFMWDSYLRELIGLSFSSDGSVIRSLHGNMMRQWDAEHGGQLRELIPAPSPNAVLAWKTVTGNPDVLLLVGPTPMDGLAGEPPLPVPVRLLDTKTGKEQARLPDLLSTTEVQAYSLAGGKRIALVTEVVLPKGHLPCRYKEGSDRVYSPTASCSLPRIPEVKPTATARKRLLGDTRVYRLTLWEGPRWHGVEQPHELESDIPFHIVDASADGNRVLTIAIDDADHPRYGARVWRTDTLDGYYSVPLSPEELSAPLRLSADGQRLIASPAMRELHVYDIETGLRVGSPLRLPDRALGTELSADGSTLFVATGSGLIQEWDFSGPQPMEARRLPPTGNIRPSWFDPTGQWLLAHSQEELQDDGPYQLWELASGQHRRPMPPDEDKHLLWNVAFTADGSKAVLATIPEPERQRIRFVAGPVQTGAQTSPAVEENGDLDALAFTASGAFLSVLSDRQGDSPSLTVYQWDLTSPQLRKLCTIEAPCGQEQADVLGFNRGATSLLTQCLEPSQSELRMWNPENCQPQLPWLDLDGTADEHRALLLYGGVASRAVRSEGRTRLRLDFEPQGQWFITPTSPPQVQDAAGRSLMLPLTPAPLGSQRRIIHLGPGGQWLLTETKRQVQIKGQATTTTLGSWFQAWDSWTGRPISPEFWNPHESISWAIRHTDGTLATFTPDGTFQRWFIGTPIHDSSWLEGLANAATGMKLGPEREPQPLEPAERQALVSAVRARLEAAAKQGEPNAKELLRVLGDGPLRQ